MLRFYPNDRLQVNLKRFFFAKSGDVRAQVARSVLASNAAFLLDFSILAALVEIFHLPVYVSVALGYLFGASLVYVLNAAWIFPERRFANRSAEYAIFVVMGAIGLFLNIFLIWLLTDIFALHYLRAKIAAGTLVFVFNFVTRKFVVFRKT